MNEQNQFKYTSKKKHGIPEFKSGYDGLLLFDNSYSERCYLFVEREGKRVRRIGLSFTQVRYNEGFIAYTTNLIYAPFGKFGKMLHKNGRVGKNE